MTTATMAGMIGKKTLLTAEEERELARRRDGGDPDARNELVERNIPIAIRMAGVFARPRPWLLDDLIGASMLGLIEAAGRFDPDRGTRFSTYASHWIGREMRSWIKDEGNLIRVPRYLHDALSLARRGLPYDARKANPERCQYARLALSAAAAGAALPGEDDHMAFVPAPEESRDDSPELVERVLSRLDGRQAEVIRLRFGLGGGEPMTLSDVGARLGVNREWARKLQIRAMAQLAEIMEGER